MHWELLTIPLIALGVWILGTLFKGGEDDRSKKNARGAGGFGGRTSPRRPVTDLNRYLEEARLRREAEEKLQAPPITTRPTLTRPPLRERQTTPRDAPPLRTREVPTPIPATSPLSRPPRAEPVPVASPVPAETAQRTPIATPVPQETPPSPILQQVRSLLSKPQSAGAAFALREIFAPPLCRRRR